MFTDVCFHVFRAITPNDPYSSFIKFHFPHWISTSLVILISLPPRWCKFLFLKLDRLFQVNARDFVAHCSSQQSNCVGRGEHWLHVNMPCMLGENTSEHIMLEHIFAHFCMSILFAHFFWWWNYIFWWQNYLIFWWLIYFLTTSIYFLTTSIYFLMIHFFFWWNHSFFW